MKKIAVYLSKEELMSILEDLKCSYLHHYGGQVDEETKLKLEQSLASFDKQAEDNSHLNTLVQSHLSDLGVEFQEEWNKKVRGEK